MRLIFLCHLQACHSRSAAGRRRVCGGLDSGGEDGARPHRLQVRWVLYIRKYNGYCYVHDFPCQSYTDRSFGRALQLSPDCSSLWHDLALAYYHLTQVHTYNVHVCMYMYIIHVHVRVHVHVYTYYVCVYIILLYAKSV